MAYANPKTIYSGPTPQFFSRSSFHEFILHHGAVVVQAGLERGRQRIDIYHTNVPGLTCVYLYDLHHNTTTVDLHGEMTAVEDLEKKILAAAAGLPGNSTVLPTENPGAEPPRRASHPSPLQRVIYTITTPSSSHPHKK